MNATTLELSATNFKNLKKADQSVSKVDLFVKYGFLKTRDLSPAAPRGFMLTNITGKYFSGVISGNLEPRGAIL